MLKAHIIKHRRELMIDVALELEEGHAVGLFGASGAGKSTILACIAGFEQPDGGFIQWNDLQLFPPSLSLNRRPLGYLTQEANLFPHLSVGENVRFGIPRDEKATEDQNEWINMLRDHLHLGPIWSAPAARISGGQARRVSLARMLARKPPLVLLDEPFTGLDRQLTRDLISALAFWSETLRFSMIAVDHQAEILSRLCPRRVIALESGRIVQAGAWDELRNHPATPSLRSLLTPI